MDRPAEVATASSYPPIAELIPHGEPMVLLDELASWAPGVACCQVTIQEGSPFVSDGVVDITASIEYMAQAVAACLGYEALCAGDGIRAGVIIGCRQLLAHAQSLPLDRRLCVDVRRTRGNATLSHFDCSIRVGDELLVEAALSLYHAA